jgi:hypothetical protein
LVNLRILLLCLCKKVWRKFQCVEKVEDSTMGPRGQVSAVCRDKKHWERATPRLDRRKKKYFG